MAHRFVSIVANNTDEVMAVDKKQIILKTITIKNWKCTENYSKVFLGMVLILFLWFL